MAQHVSAEARCSTRRIGCILAVSIKVCVSCRSACCRLLE
jgi:hypothetical protein